MGPATDQIQSKKMHYFIKVQNILINIFRINFYTLSLGLLAYLISLLQENDICHQIKQNFSIINIETFISNSIFVIKI